MNIVECVMVANWRAGRPETPGLNDSMATPKISVLIPTRNYAHFLTEAIDSVLDQDFQDFEVLISDNASTDTTPEVTARYSARDPRIRIYNHNTDWGMVQNFNWCLSQSRGEYIKFLFGDDRLANRRALGQLVALLDANPAAALAGSARQVINHDSQPVAVWNDFGPEGLHPASLVIARCQLENSNLIGEPSVVILRRRQSPPAFDPDYRQLVDLEQWFRLLENGDFVFSSEVLSCFRRHDSQQSEVNRADKVALVEAARLALKYLDLCPLTVAEKKYLTFRHARWISRQGRHNTEARRLKRELTSRLSGIDYQSCWCRYRWSRLCKDFRKTASKSEHEPHQLPQH